MSVAGSPTGAISEADTQHGPLTGTVAPRPNPPASIFGPLKADWWFQVPRCKVVTQRLCNVRSLKDAQEACLKRKALLIGNTDGLAGVQIDIQKTKTFLLSDVGGSWFDSEIDVLVNPQRTELLAHLAQVRRSSTDYVFLLFSGHGGLIRRKTLLVLNDAEETIEEDALFKIASRQISIFDCCRALVPEIALEEAYAVARLTRIAKANAARQRFDARIMQAIPQQVRLYGCSKGQMSNDTPDGAIYLQNLLRAAQSLNSNEMFKTAEQAHSVAVAATITETEGDQTPDAFLPKCLLSQQLILSVRP